MPASTRIQISQQASRFLAMLTPCPRGSDVLFECVRAKCGMCLELGWIRLASRWRLQSKTVQETQIDYLLKRSRCSVLTAHTPLDTTGYNHVHPIYCLSLAIFVSNLLCLSSILKSGHFHTAFRGPAINRLRSNITTGLIMVATWGSLLTISSAFEFVYLLPFHFLDNRLLCHMAHANIALPTAVDA
ncbi:hypothetical protein F5878DRAFT_409672 [Lentinula raphanica]|uniref:Uncharacterized protein n=1 Tax=Lentinula raphanica TaxID=153919 RepID=A0AA38PGK8_9AGAR|nr:hypothetical protein F5878DRAFT_409672 [Lentinula raphanica]